MRKTATVVLSTMVLVALAFYARLEAQPSDPSLQKRVAQLEKQVAVLEKTAASRGTFAAVNLGAAGPDGTYNTWLPLTVAKGGKVEHVAKCEPRFMTGVKVNPALGLQVVCAQGAWTGTPPPSPATK